MSGPASPPPPPAPAASTTAARPGASLTAAPASVAVQASTYLVAVLGIALVSAQFGQPDWFLLATGALTAGVLVSLTTDVGRFFGNVAGWVAGIGAALSVVVVIELLQGYTQVEVPLVVAVVAGVFVLGLDWGRVTRLRAVVVLSGLCVVPLVGSDRAWAYPAAIGWLLVALGTLWLLERDGRHAIPAPESLQPGAPVDDDPLRPADVLRVVGLALAAGLVIAFLLGRPSCSSDTPRTGFAGSGLPGRSVPGASTPTGGGSASPSTIFQLDAGGHEQQLGVDDQGRATVTGPDGRRYTIEQHGDRQIVRDDTGRVVSELGKDDLTAIGPDGQARTFQRDAEGNLSFEGADGQRYTLSEEGGALVLRDGSGRQVAQGSLDDDHLYLRDPDGNVLVPDQQGGGTIPIPGAVTRDQLGGLSSGRTTTVDDQGRTVVRDPDGSTRTYDVDDQGDPRVRVEPATGPTRTYVHDRDDQLVREYDEEGTLLRTFAYDPEGRTIDGSPSEGAGGLAAPTTAPGGQPDDPDPPTDVPWGLISLLVLLVAAIAVAAWALTRRTPPDPERSWAERLADRLDTEGRAHGRGRRRDETVVDHSRALAEQAIPDPRLVGVGVVVSDALFAPAEPSPETRAWAEGVVDEVVELHPRPRWTDRFRRGRRGTGRGSSPV